MFICNDYIIYISCVCYDRWNVIEEIVEVLVYIPNSTAATPQKSELSLKDKYILKRMYNRYTVCGSVHNITHTDNICVQHLMWFEQLSYTDIHRLVACDSNWRLVQVRGPIG